MEPFVGLEVITKNETASAVRSFQDASYCLMKSSGRICLDKFLAIFSNSLYFVHLFMFISHMSSHMPKADKTFYLNAYIHIYADNGILE